MAKLRRTLTTLTTLAAAALITGCTTGTINTNSSLSDNITNALNTITTGASGYTAAEVTNDYYTDQGNAQITHTDAPTGTITYCPTDNLGRATCTYGNLTTTQRAAAKASGRQDITVDPAGWPTTNPKVTIPATSTTGSSAYKGYLWNRSHLIADSLGGDATVENLVTGTRTQNVGSTQTNGDSDGGMAHTERIARDYLDNTANASCPLYYSVTPNYNGSELLPRTVTVDMRSCDGSIDTRVEVSNTANGFDIDYLNGGTK